MKFIGQGSPTPGPRTATRPQPVRNLAAQQEGSGGQASEASSAAPHRSHYHLNHPPCPQSVEKLSSMKPVPGAKKVGDHSYTGRQWGRWQGRELLWKEGPEGTF